jgi:hypothetical protein
LALIARTEWLSLIQCLAQDREATDLVESILGIEPGGIVAGPEEPGNMEATEAHLPQRIREQHAANPRAPEIAVLIVARFAQGLGAAVMMP